MLEHLDVVLRRFSPSALMATALLLLTITATLDHVTGYQISFSVFYITPIAILTWYGSRRAGLAFSALAAAVWQLIDVTSGAIYDVAAIPYWNALVRLAYFVTITMLVALLREQLERERRLGLTDPLTGLQNRRAILEATQVTLDLCRRLERPICVGYLDVDGFKAVNDTRGHDAGDRLLASVAATLDEGTRRTDLVARIGGDEFVMVLPDTDETQARTVAAKLMRLLEERMRIEEWPVRFSMGLASFSVAPDAPEDGFRCADRLMYEVKNTGGGNILLRSF